MNDREVQFLKSRQERQEDRRQDKEQKKDEEQEKKQEHEDYYYSPSAYEKNATNEEIWSRIQEALKDWDRRLKEQTIAHNPHQYNKTATQRQAILRQLDILENQLSLNSLFTTTINDNDDDDDHAPSNVSSHSSSFTSSNLPTENLEQQHQQQLSSLPLADIRRLHQEFADRMQLIQQQRDRVCPPTKFVFRRYRAAIQLRHKQQQQEDKKKNNNTKENQDTHTTPSSSSCDIQENLFFVGRSIQNLQNAIITELFTGETIQIIHRDQKDKQPQFQSQPLQQSLLLQNLQDCQINITATHYKALHILRVHNSTIHLDSSVQGAIHVTDCTHTTLTGAGCHQLRIHDAKHTRIDISSIAAPPILEGCHDMTLIARQRSVPTNNAAAVQEDGDRHSDNNSQYTMIQQTKDFNWLRTDQPSPNFQIIVVEQKDDDDDDVDGHSEATNCGSATVSETNSNNNGNHEQQQQQQYNNAHGQRSGEEDVPVQEEGKSKVILADSVHNDDDDDEL